MREVPIDPKRPSKQAEALANEIMECLTSLKTLPTDSELKSPLSLEDRQEWRDGKISLLAMTTHIFEIERGASAGKHTLDMIALFSGMTREAVRQIETKAIKKMAKKHPKILKELKEVYLDTPSESEGAGYYNQMEKGWHQPGD